MSFGWSVGDVAAGINLVNKIIKSVSNTGGARVHFQELKSELLSLSRALDEISELAQVPSQIPEIVALKFAACLCEETLKRFYEKIKPFDSTLSTGAEKHVGKRKAAPKMVRWELLIKKDIPELRSYLVAHVGSLNLRLNTAILKVASKSLANANQYRATQESRDILQHQLNTEATSIYEKISKISKGETIPKLDSLLAVATRVWKSQNELMEMLSEGENRLPSPDVRHTWAQPPLKFEDALGRIIPIPSEYDWDKLEAIIQAQFKRGPGHTKVRSGEYELYDETFTDISIIKEKNFYPRPGMKITMAFILGQYAGSESCPRLGCKSQSFKSQGFEMKGRVCIECQSWFRKSKSSLRSPLKPPGPVGYPESYLSTDISHQIERQAYKNLSVYITDLPPTPKRFRDKYHRAREPTSVTRMKQVASPVPYVHNSWRPQTFQMSELEPIPVSYRPHTLNFEDITPVATRRGLKAQQVAQTVPNPSDATRRDWAADILEFERILDVIGKATLDADFKYELSAIEQWFRVLSEDERTASLYCVLQLMDLSHIPFLSLVLQQMAKAGL